MKTENKEQTFESALSRLETIVKRLEAGEESLESSIAFFEEGVSLVRFCSDALSSAEQKVKILLNDGESEAPFSSESEEGKV